MNKTHKKYTQHISTSSRLELFPDGTARVATVRKATGQGKVFPLAELKEILKADEQNGITSYSLLREIELYEQEPATNIHPPVKPGSSCDLQTLVNSAVLLYGNDVDLNQVDVSELDDLDDVFSDSSFNGDISKWDVSKVRSMHYTFSDSAFNGDISNWNVSSLEEAYNTFKGSAFNGDISKWDVRSLRTAECMFEGSPFSQDISMWRPLSLTSADYMLDVRYEEGKVDKYPHSLRDWGMFIPSHALPEIRNWVFGDSRTWEKGVDEEYNLDNAPDSLLPDKPSPPSKGITIKAAYGIYRSDSPEIVKVIRNYFDQHPMIAEMFPDDEEQDALVDMFADKIMTENGFSFDLDADSIVEQYMLFSEEELIDYIGEDGINEYGNEGEPIRHKLLELLREHSAEYRVVDCPSAERKYIVDIWSLPGKE